MADLSWLDPKTEEEVAEIPSELRGHVERISGDRLRTLRLYGSYARGEPDPGSDLDVLVALDRIDSYGEEIDRASHDVGVISLGHDLPISTVFLSEDRWRSDDTTFVRNIRHEGHLA